jgi:hypothetical protein
MRQRHHGGNGAIEPPPDRVFVCLDCLNGKGDDPRKIPTTGQPGL